MPARPSTTPERWPTPAAPAPAARAAWRPARPAQRQLRRALRHAERQHRIHQEGAGEQRHQGQHREVHAVGAREAVHALQGVLCLGKLHAQRASRAGRSALFQQLRARVSWALAQVDARELVLAASQFLRRADVHHGQGRAARRHHARHLHQMLLQAGVQREGWGCRHSMPASPRACCAAAFRNTVAGASMSRRSAPGMRAWRQRRGHGRQQQRVGAHAGAAARHPVQAALLARTGSSSQGPARATWGWRGDQAVVRLWDMAPRVAAAAPDPAGRPRSASPGRTRPAPTR